MVELLSLDGATKLQTLRQAHPRFVYRTYDVDAADGRVHFAFDYAVDDGPSFRPELYIDGLTPDELQRLDDATLRNFAFHLGLMEVPSYWKATASPEIAVEPGHLDAWQRDWWHILLMEGMGEFFFVNDIDFTAADFLTISSSAPPSPPLPFHGALDASRVLVPVGGGKDSAVSCELLGHMAGIEPVHFAVNPTPASRALIEIAGGTRTISVERNIDPGLLALNRQGYLNGHTPFSAVLAFLSATCAVLTETKHIAFSNERSAAEGNVWYRGHEINHQYSKTPAFERAFREYAGRYLATGLNYFSFLRPLSELQIAGLFAGMPRYDSDFRSCNRGQSTNSWCGTCPKCLSVFTLLYPFSDRLLAIFGRNLLDDESLLPIASGLLRPEEVKPFECVGTREENLVAFQLCLRKARHDGLSRGLLSLLEADLIPGLDTLDEQATRLLASWSDNHSLEPRFEAVLRERLSTLHLP